MPGNGPLDTFCGDLGPFWDLNLTWNTNDPDFSVCFQKSALLWVPCAWILVTAPIYAVYLRMVAVSAPIPHNRLNITKTLLSAVLTVLWGVDVIKTLLEYDAAASPPPVLVTACCLQAGCFLLSAVWVQVERRKAFITSGVLFIFWLFQVIVGIVPFRSNIRRQILEGQVDDMFRFVIFYIQYPLLVVQLIVSCVSDVESNAGRVAIQKLCPEVQASFLSRVTFWWMNRIVFTGYKKSLEEDDLWQLNPRDDSTRTAALFEAAWQKEFAKGNKQRSRAVENGYVEKAGGSSDESSPLLGGKEAGTYGKEADSGKAPKSADGSMLKVLVRVYGFTLLRSHLCKLICDVLTFVGPLLQSQLIDFTTDTSMESWKGYLFAALFAVTSIVNAFFFHQLFHIGMTLGMRIKAALISAVYRKALRMNNESRKLTTVGEIVNLMSVDAQRMQDVTGYLWMTWSSPLQIVISIYFLWNIVGASSLAGVALMVLLIPVNAYLAIVQRRLQLKQMKLKDQRIKLMNEVLNGIKVLKLYTWELSFRDKIAEIREAELQNLKLYSYIQAIGTFTWTCTPFLIMSEKGILLLYLIYTTSEDKDMILSPVMLATFVTFVLLGGVLDAQTAFVSLSLFNILRFPINLLPMVVSYIVTASVSIKRLSTFLQHGEIDDDNVQHDPYAEHPIAIKGGTFAWGRADEDPLVLKNVSLQVSDGQLMAVVGRVGAGKSSLVSAILGEMEKIGGSVSVRGSVAYVAQQAWIQNASVRDNILFGREFDERRYGEVLDACALRPDLAILPAADLTEVGEKGINLSGGQKQRISLARAIYSDADLYLLDDPLSAVDSHVGKHIFEHVVGGPNALLKSKTRVLVTHGLQWLPMVDQIVVMVDGQISERGSYDEVLSHDGPFASFLKTHLLDELQSESETDDTEINAVKRMLKRVDTLSAEEEVEVAQLTKTRRRRRQSSMMDGEETGSVDRKRTLSRSMSTPSGKPVAPLTDPSKLIQEETSEVGKVKMVVFAAYVRALGLVLTTFFMGMFFLYQVFSVASSIWLSVWTQDPVLQNSSISVNSSAYTSTRNMYLGVYGAFGAVQAVFILFYSLVAALCSVRASRILHARLLDNILRSPMTFFERTPIGRILNRFSRDIETIDNILPQLLRSWLNTLFSVTATFIVISYSTPIFLVIVIPLAIVYYFIQRFYIPTSRQLKRIESTTRSPIYVHFSETITGAGTIRAYGAERRFNETSLRHINHNLVFYFSSIASNRWIGFRLEVVGAAIVFSAAIFAVIGRNSLTGGLVGLSISYALQVTQSLNWLVRMTSDLETNVVAVERVKEYSETQPEAEWYIEETKPPGSWPAEGQVVLDHYSTRYRPGLDLVLRGIDVDIKPREKIGIVGRTGAGKSSLTLALFRIIESAGGQILIDGVRIADLGLHQLRSKLTILPQDPVIFSGSLRMNLDPFMHYADAELWHVLDQSHLRTFVQSLSGQLDYECGEGGQNLSVGQRQLLCLARTMLRRTKVLILDEATAAVDLQTDQLIQNTIRDAFSECTVLTIAHRLNTIMDSTRILVLESGEVVEFDTPQRLLSNKKGVFYSMAKDAGLVS